MSKLSINEYQDMVDGLAAMADQIHTRINRDTLRLQAIVNALHVLRQSQRPSPPRDMGDA